MTMKIIDFVPSPEPGRPFDPKKNAADAYEAICQNYILAHPHTKNYMLDYDEHPDFNMPWETIFERHDGSRYYWDPIEERITHEIPGPKNGGRSDETPEPDRERLPYGFLYAPESEVAIYRRRRTEYGLMWRAFSALREALLYDNEDGSDADSHGFPHAATFGDYAAFEIGKMSA